MRFLLSLLFLGLAVITNYEVDANMGAILKTNKKPKKEVIGNVKKGEAPYVAPPPDGSETFSLKDDEDKVKLFEGDIVYTDEIHQMMNGEAPFDAAYNKQWTNRVMPYTFERGHETLRPYVNAAITKYGQQLGKCLTFRYYRSRSDIRRAGIRNYVVFFRGGGCYSMVGMVGGEQKISLGNGCTRVGTVMHEMMHALGFWHEQSRSDRDKHIIIYTQNINPRMRYNFEMKRSDKLGEPYDIYSVMHYPPRAFSSNGRIVIKHRGGVTNFGWQQQLSTTDVKQLKKYYKCAGTGTGTGTGGGGKKVDGNWSSWESYSRCSRTCGGGVQTKRRTCTNPTPKNGGRGCSGKSSDTRQCNKQRCPITTNNKCKDDNQYCADWARRGECKKNPNYMLVNCKKSCKKCKGTGTGTTNNRCRDKHYNCTTWRSYCTSSHWNYRNWMSQYCPKTCGKCY